MVSFYYLKILKQIIFLTLFCLLAGCATTQTTDMYTKNDSLEPANRVFFDVNETIDQALIKPIAEIYVDVTPNFIRTGITNFFENLAYLNVILNDLLQGKINQGVSDVVRFVANSTMGIGGLFDVATPMGLPENNEDFGQTLGAWGVNSGPFLMIPIYGPSTPRSLAGRSVSSVLSGTFAIEETDMRLGITALDALETRARYLEVETLIIGDRYSFIRDSYMQYQEFESSNGLNQVDDFVDDMDDFFLD